MSDKSKKHFIENKRTKPLYSISAQFNNRRMPMTMKSITVHQLKKMMDEQQKFQLIDCREEDEYEFCTIGGELIPVGEIEENVEKISRDIPVIVYCHTGMRSARVVAHLQRYHGFPNLFNLTGGIHAWSREIDPSVPQY